MACWTRRLWRIAAIDRQTARCRCRRSATCPLQSVEVLIRAYDSARLAGGLVIGRRRLAVDVGRWCMFYRWPASKHRAELEYVARRIPTQALNGVCCRSVRRRLRTYNKVRQPETLSSQSTTSCPAELTSAGRGLGASTVRPADKHPDPILQHLIHSVMWVTARSNCSDHGSDVRIVLQQHNSTELLYATTEASLHYNRLLLPAGRVESGHGSIIRTRFCLWSWL